LSPRSASSATAALNWSEKFRRFVILVSIHSCWIHLSTLSEFAGPLQAQRDGGERPGQISAEKARIKELERENRELRQANEILKKASAYFAQAELDRPLRK
jgi:cell division protein FtsL